VNQTFGVALRWNEIVPAASGDVLRIQFQNPIRQRISLMMVKEQPTI
jgi:hypothetical protein